MSERYRIKVSTWPMGDYFTHAARVYSEEGQLRDMSLGTSADEALTKARRWVEAQTMPAVDVYETWVDEQGRDAAAPDAHSLRAES